MRFFVDMFTLGDFLAEFVLPFYRCEIFYCNRNVFRIAADRIYQCSGNLVCSKLFLIVCSAFEHFDRNMGHGMFLLEILFLIYCP